MDKAKENGLKIFSEELLGINKICLSTILTNNLSQEKKSTYYLPFKFRINDKEEPKLLVEDGFIFMQVKKKPLYEYYSICPAGKPTIDTISKNPPRIPKIKSKTKKQSPAKK